MFLKIWNSFCRFFEMLKGKKAYFLCKFCILVFIWELCYYFCHIMYLCILLDRPRWGCFSRPVSEILLLPLSSNHISLFSYTKSWLVVEFPKFIRFYYFYRIDTSILIQILTILSKMTTKGPHLLQQIFSHSATSQTKIKISSWIFQHLFIICLRRFYKNILVIT